MTTATRVSASHLLVDTEEEALKLKQEIEVRKETEDELAAGKQQLKRSTCTLNRRSR